MENPIQKVFSHLSRPHERREERRSEMSSLIRMAILLIGVLAFSTMVCGAPNTNVTSVLCNTGVYTSGDPFATSLAYVLAELETVTPSRQGHDYYNISPYPNAFAYGHAACGTALPNADCAACLVTARKVMIDTCNNCIGARAILYDCTIRYEQYPFNN